LKRKYLLIAAFLWEDFSLMHRFKGQFRMTGIDHKRKRPMKIHFLLIYQAKLIDKD